MSTMQTEGEAGSDDESESMCDELQRRLDAADGRETKLTILREYMSPAMAEDALGFIEGDHQGDLIDLSSSPDRESAG
jgi:hypothetical protein